MGAGHSSSVYLTRLLLSQVYCPRIISVIIITITVECDNALTMKRGSTPKGLKITLPNVDEKELIKQLEKKKTKKYEDRELSH